MGPENHNITFTVTGVKVMNLETGEIEYETFDFPEALRRLKQGKFVTRQVVEAEMYFSLAWTYTGDRLMLIEHMINGGNRERVYMSLEGILATDWVEVE